MSAQGGPPSPFGLSGGLPVWAREGETFSLTLGVDGRFAGMQHWVIRPERSAVVTRVSTEFGGVLPTLRLHQTSRLHPRTLALLHYAEGEGGGGGGGQTRPSYELELDDRAGVTRLRQRGDLAVEPLTRDLLDPLSLLLWLRGWDAPVGGTNLRPLAGGGVYVQRLPDEQVGALPARVFLLRPGSAGLWVGQTPDAPMLRLTQPTRFGLVTASADPAVAPAPAAAGSGQRRERRRVG